MTQRPIVAEGEGNCDRNVYNVLCSVLEVEDMKIKDIYPVHQKINLVERTYK
jgi:hypothetical protein